MRKPTLSNKKEQITMKFGKAFTLIFIVVVLLYGCNKKNVDITHIKSLIDNGDFSKAERHIKTLLIETPSLSPTEKLELSFEIERMERIRKDFTKTREDVLQYIKKYIPDVKDQDIKRWEKEKSLEYMIIDSKKWYFNQAAPNLFRINKELRKIKEKVDGKSVRKFPLDKHIEEIVNTTLETGENSVLPVRLRIKQSVVVKPGVVPENEMIRCWIPFPREIPGRQENIHIIKTEPTRYILSDNLPQNTIYFEKPSCGDKPTEFWVEYTYTSYGFYKKINPEKVTEIKEANRESLIPYLQEEPPHITFTDKIKRISNLIIGQETNPYRKAQKIFEWIDTNIPWASAREYSTIRNISDYCISNMHGDCGIQTILFITLCRYNGIPARWQSGWEFQPPDDSMHDWGEVYFEPYGWVPVDVTYGLRNSRREEVKWFYLSGIDSYRLIFNDAYSQPFFPAKIYPRSETVDSQRGEVEWRGGNLYFDKWGWKLEWEKLK